MPTDNILPQIIRKLEELEHAYLGVQLRDGSKHLIVLFDYGQPVHCEVDGKEGDPVACVAAMIALIDDCIETGRHVVITAIDEGNGQEPDTDEKVYSAAYLDGQLVRIDPEALADYSGEGGWDDLEKLLG